MRPNTILDDRSAWPPIPGCFRIRLVRGGWAVPARIEHDGALWRVTIDGTASEAADPVHAGAERVWHYGKAIEDWEYADLLRLKEWAAAHDPSHPCLSPRQPIDPMRLRPVQIRRRIV
jgi:hypothetical protein